jgi:hypothetical protein
MLAAFGANHGQPVWKNPFPNDAVGQAVARLAEYGDSAELRIKHFVPLLL